MILRFPVLESSTNRSRTNATLTPANYEPAADADRSRFGTKPRWASSRMEAARADR